MLKIGRVLDVRWIASSLRTVRAVWSSFPALQSHFMTAGRDGTRDSTTRKKFQGLAKRLGSPQFVRDLGLMYDVLQELSSLSLELQATSIAFSRAEHVVKRTIRVLESFKDNPSDHMQEVLQLRNALVFKTITLHDNVKLKTLNSN